MTSYHCTAWFGYLYFDAREDEPEWIFALNMSQRDEDDYLSSADTWRALTLLDWD